MVNIGGPFSVWALSSRSGVLVIFLGLWVQVGHFGVLVIWGRILEFGNVAV